MDLALIARLHGTIHFLDSGRVLVDVAGVGYEVFVSSMARQDLQEETLATVEIYTHVTDSQLKLFGFVSPEEKAIFERLISVSGIGPKTALGILSGTTAPELAAMIVRGDSSALGTLPGIGKKSADRLILELKDRLAKMVLVDGEGSAQSSGSMQGVAAGQEDAVAALMYLGYRRTEAVQAVMRVLGDEPALAAGDGSRLVKQALRGLASV